MKSVQIVTVVGLIILLNAHYHQATPAHGSEIGRGLQSAIDHLVKYVQKSHDKSSIQHLKMARDQDKEYCLERSICEISASQETNVSPIVSAIRETFE